MTEVPEHLLKRSKERRAALGLPGGDAGDTGETAPASAVVAPVAAQAKAPAARPTKTVLPPPPPPKPKAPYVLAAESRKKIPFWAMGVVALLPVWAFVYANGVTQPPSTDQGLIHGEDVYGSCQVCHGPTGGGGTGAKLNDGEVLKTFPDPVAMMEWIHLGANDWTGADGPKYGDPNREGGQHDINTLSAIMGSFDDLSPEELAGVTRYIRETLSGEPTPSPEVIEEYETWAEEAIESAENDEIIYKNTEPDPERIKLLGEG